MINEDEFESKRNELCDDILCIINENTYDWEENYKHNIIAEIAQGMAQASLIAIYNRDNKLGKSLLNDLIKNLKNTFHDNLN